MHDIIARVYTHTWNGYTLRLRAREPETMEKGKLEVNQKINRWIVRLEKHRLGPGCKYDLIEFSFPRGNLRVKREYHTLLASTDAANGLQRCCNPREHPPSCLAVELLFRFVRTPANINIPTLDLIAENGF